MLMVLSPAKSLDFETPPAVKRFTEPALLDEAATLVRKARTLSAAKLSALMGISDDLAKLNAQRFKAWSPPFTPANAQPAVYAFTGDVYQGLDIRSLKSADVTFAQKHLRILSGLYGVLRPLDLMQAYRLEMGLPFAVGRAKSLYEFWADTITQTLNADLRATKSDVLLNLASQEYFKSVRPDVLDGRVVECAFKERKDGKLRMVSFYAKKARGLMARYVIQSRAKGVDDLHGFDLDGYAYDPDGSTDRTLLFTRDAA